MFSKNMFKVVSIGLVTIYLLSCNLKVGETPPEAAIPEYRADTCFTPASEAIGNFFSGEATNEELGAGWDCFGSMVKEFKTKVRCKVREKCSPGEIAQFIEDNFLDEGADVKQQVISSELQTQFMKIKKLFLGGNLEYITPVELDHLIELMGELKSLSQDINPSMKVLTLNWENKLKSSDVSLFDFEAVNENLVRVSQRFSSLINKDDNVYYFDDFQNLMSEIGKFLGSDSGWTGTIRNYLPLVKKLKKSITGGEEESLKDNEWNLFLLLSSRAYIQFLRYYYFIKDLQPEFTSLRLAYSARTIEEVFQILYDLLSHKESNQVSRAEIEDLFKSFSDIWPVFKTSPGFVSEIMKVKKVLIGGTEQGFGKDDFLRAQKKVNLIKQIVEKFTPYYQFYGLSWHPELLKQADAFAYYAKATKNFEDLVSQLTDEFKFESGYSYVNLIRMMEEVEKLYPAVGESSIGKLLQEYSCLAQLGTDIMLDKQNHQIKNSCDQIDLSSVDLARLFKQGSKALNIFWDYYYFLSRSQVLYNDLDFQIKVRDFAFNVVAFFKNTVEQRKSKRISNYELKSIVAELMNLEIIPKTIKKSTVDSIIQTLTTRVLVPENMKRKMPKSDGIETFHLDQIYRELDNFLGVNIFIHQAYENKINQKFDYNFLLGRFKQAASISDNPNFRLGMTEYVKNFQTSFPLTVTADDRIYFYKHSNPTYDKKTLQRFNAYRFLAGVLLRSYAKRESTTQAISNTLTDCEVKSAFLDLKPVLVDLGIISESTGTGFIDARFFEANLFLTKSDGNDSVSFEELAEFANFIMSGFVVDDMAKKSLAAASRDPAQPDCAYSVENKETLVNLSCLQKVYKNSLSTLLSSMPNYVNYARNENPNEWANAFLNNLKAAGYKPRADLMVSLTDAALFPHILQYGETLFIKFDSNADGFIDKVEAIKAFPYFAQLLKKVARKQLEAGDIKEQDLEAMFTYILKYGKIPECNKPFVLLCLFDRNVTNWLDWRSNYRQSNYNFAANRSQISRILGIISEMVATSPSVAEDSCKL